VKEKMTPSEITDARLDIGLAWGLKRPLQKVELGALLGYVNRDMGAAVADWETGRTRPPGPALTAIQALLDGWRPVGWQEFIRERGRLSALDALRAGEARRRAARAARGRRRRVWQQIWREQDVGQDREQDDEQLAGELFSAMFSAIIEASAVDPDRAVVDGDAVMTSLARLAACFITMEPREKQPLSCDYLFTQIRFLIDELRDAPEMHPLRGHFADFEDAEKVTTQWWKAATWPWSEKAIFQAGKIGNRPRSFVQRNNTQSFAAIERTERKIPRLFWRSGPIGPLHFSHLLLSLAIQYADNAYVFG
jgi:hypothetical protein